MKNQRSSRVVGKIAKKGKNNNSIQSRRSQKTQRQPTRIIWPLPLLSQNHNPPLNQNDEVEEEEEEEEEEGEGEKEEEEGAGDD